MEKYKAIDQCFWTKKKNRQENILLGAMISVCIHVAPDEAIIVAIKFGKHVACRLHAAQAEGLHEQAYGTG